MLLCSQVKITWHGFKDMEAMSAFKSFRNMHMHSKQEAIAGWFPSNRRKNMRSFCLFHALNKKKRRNHSVYLKLLNKTRNKIWFSQSTWSLGKSVCVPTPIQGYIYFLIISPSWDWGSLTCYTLRDLLPCTSTFFFTMELR